ncbi:alpha-amylase family glycosyl hydrolase [Cyanobium gracile]|uniref:Glycosidase n=1 Tax=Cyanobium gracile (strain ATCC 27147 / PCC 6307) TaxID=292564 RepID=K9P6N8_CYAGP|nr:alpha-amylase family glycosyl hydrolase [Cyanobium gracile]AFY29062.1 glycosidase [Cyanobium gracile PCC 6307]
MFLLPDRFSDGQEASRPLLDRENLNAARPSLPGGSPWRFDKWAISGSGRFQGGSITGITTKLGYLKDLGVTSIWVGPIFKQRCHENNYHGYAIQDFLQIDPRFGTRQNQVGLVNQAHAAGLRIILDVILNHSGENWLYYSSDGDVFNPHYRTVGSYQFGAWRGDHGQPISAINGIEDGVWPQELQDPDYYTRAGKGSLGGENWNNIDNPDTEYRRTDFDGGCRDFKVGNPNVLSALSKCYKYWIALTDCDGFRIDTLKHVSLEEARNFCGSIMEFCANIGKADFFLVDEVAGGDFNQERYINVLEQNFNATLDIGETRIVLNRVSKGLESPKCYFDAFPKNIVFGSSRNLGGRHVSVLDDHVHAFGEKIRFSSDAVSDHQVVAGVAIQLFTLSIPCIYAGTEEALSGPEPSQRQWLPGWNGTNNCYLREAMFGPEHPLRSGIAGLSRFEDTTIPGFVPFGTSGHQCFDPNHPTFKRIASLTTLRGQYPVLRVGRQYVRPISIFGRPFEFLGNGELMAWSRILDDEEAICIVNVNGNQKRGADVLVDAGLSGTVGALTVVLNTAEVVIAPEAVRHPVGSILPIQRTSDGKVYLEVRDVGPSEVLVLVNYP